MKKFGFTLAEVLITLGIIGVVAALSMPQLIQNHKKAVTSAQLKKFNSVMANWASLATNELGEPRYWNWGSIDAETCTNIYFKPFLKTARIEYGDFSLNINEKCTSNNNSSGEAGGLLRTGRKLGGLQTADPNRCISFFKGDIKFTLNDGSVFYLAPNAIGTNKPIALDTNGDKGPNKLGRDRFLFNFSYLGGTKRVCNSNRYICAMRDVKSSDAFAPRSRNEIIAGCKEGYNFGIDRDDCAILLEFDNWEFKKDYPYKL